MFYEGTNGSAWYAGEPNHRTLYALEEGDYDVDDMGTVECLAVVTMASIIPTGIVGVLINDVLESESYSGVYGFGVAALLDLLIIAWVVASYRRRVREFPNTANLAVPEDDFRMQALHAATNLPFQYLSDNQVCRALVDSYLQNHQELAELIRRQMARRIDPDKPTVHETALRAELAAAAVAVAPFLLKQAEIDGAVMAEADESLVRAVLIESRSCRNADELTEGGDNRRPKQES